MKMNQVKTLLTAVAIFDMAYVGLVSAEDILYRIKKWRKKKKKSNASVLDEEEDFDLDWDEEEDFDLDWLDDEVFDLDGLDEEDDEDEEGNADDEDEADGEPTVLTKDIIKRVAHTIPVRRIVEVIYEQPEIRPFLRCLKYEERAAAESLLSAYIGYLADEAPEADQTFPELRELLNMTNTNPGSDHMGMAEQILEESAEGTGSVPSYLVDYRVYRATLRQFDFVDKRRVVEACRLIIGIVMVRLGIAFDPYDKAGVA
ncbi:MAG: hypothetical protein LUE16_03825 [Lachnospiraceae bacterium]|nr:hypothetical protein [Lachnospiraceae bacterium]